jgi:hypothetical protein
MDSPSGNPEPGRIRTGWWGLLALAGAAGMAIPTRFWSGLPDLCLFHRLTGLPCPTCGLTRSWSALLHGQWTDACRFHALGPAALFALVLWAASGFRRLPAKPRWQGMLWCAALVWAGYSLARMAGWVGRPPQA